MYRKIISRFPHPNHDNWVWWALIAMIVAIVLLGTVLLLQMALRVSGRWSDGRPMTPTVSPVPRMGLSPARGGPGEPITVTGSDWPVGEVITLWLAAPAGDELPAIESVTTTVGLGGTFSAVVSVPVIRPWSQLPEVRIQGVGQASSTTVTAVFNLTTPVTLTPDVTGPATPTPLPTATPTPDPAATPTAEASAWRGEYYNNISLRGNPSVVREDAELNFDWGTSPPASGILADGFSVRWRRTVTFSAGTYRFYATADDGVRIYLDGQLLIDEWHGTRSVVYTADRTLLAGEHEVVVAYYEAAGRASVRVWWDQPSLYPQWRAEYFDNPDLTGTPVLTRNDVAVDFDWGARAPAAGVAADKFSARWTRTVNFEGGTYRFRILVDDGARLYVDGARVIDAWTNGSAREVTGQATLAAGDHILRLEYYDAGGDALVQLSWERADAYPDWKGSYWRNASLSGLPALVRNDASVDFDWGAGSPSSEIPNDNFSAEWTRTVEFTAGTYLFTIWVDDGTRLWVDDRLVIDAWEDGAARQVSARLPLAAGAHTLRLAYYERLGRARINLDWEEVPPVFEGWRGEYWSNATLSGEPTLIRDDAEIVFDWGKGAPAVGLPQDNFSARWRRTVDLEAGVYRFNALADDGVRVSVNGERVIDEWHTSPGDTVIYVDLPLAQGDYELVVEYYEATLDASIRVWFERIGSLATPTPTQLRTPTPTQSRTPTPTSTVMPTSTSTPVPGTATHTPTVLPTQSQTPTPTETPTPTLTPTATETPPPSPTLTPTATETPSPTPTPTQTPTGTPTGTVTPTPTLTPITDTVRINEVMPVVGKVDWNSDGSVNADDAWVELFNPTDQPFDLSWWVLEVKGIGQYGYTFPVATTLNPDAYLVVFMDQTDFGLTTGTLRLRQGALVYEEMPLRPLPADRSFSRNAWGYWHVGWVPTPGSLNLPPAASGRAR
jgi:hypothetical protein